MNKIVIRIISMFLLLCTFFIIFGFSSQDGEKSGNMSSGIVSKVIEILPWTKNKNIEEKQDLIKNIDPVIRKVAHFSIYTLVGMCMMSFISTFELSKTKRIGVSLITGMTYAASDEFHQSFIPRKIGRNTRCMH